MPKAKKSAPAAEACKYCGRRFARVSDLHRHINDKHERTRNYKCPQCEYENGQESNCRRHMLSMHKSKEDPIVMILVQVDGASNSNSNQASASSSSSSSRVPSPPVSPATPDYDYFAQVANGSLQPSGSGTPELPPLPRSYSAPTNAPPRFHPYLHLQPQGYPLPQERHSMPELGNAAPFTFGMNLPRTLSLDSAVSSWGQAPTPGTFLGLPGLSLPGIPPPPPPQPAPMQLYENGVGPAYLEPLDLGMVDDSPVDLPVPQPQLADAAPLQRAPTPLLPLPPPQEDEMQPADTSRTISDAELLELGIPPSPSPGREPEEEDQALLAFLASVGGNHTF